MKPNIETSLGTLSLVEVAAWGGAGRTAAGPSQREVLPMGASSLFWLWEPPPALGAAGTGGVGMLTGCSPLGGRQTALEMLMLCYQAL